MPATAGGRKLCSFRFHTILFEVCREHEVLYLRQSRADAATAVSGTGTPGNGECSLDDILGKTGQGAVEQLLARLREASADPYAVPKDELSALLADAAAEIERLVDLAKNLTVMSGVGLTTSGGPLL